MPESTQSREVNVADTPAGGVRSENPLPAAPPPAAAVNSSAVPAAFAATTCPACGAPKSGTRRFAGIMAFTLAAMAWKIRSGLHRRAAVSVPACASACVAAGSSSSAMRTQRFALATMRTGLLKASLAALKPRYAETVNGRPMYVACGSESMPGSPAVRR